jgi:hypothetical protein
VAESGPGSGGRSSCSPSGRERPRPDENVGERARLSSALGEYPRDGPSSRIIYRGTDVLAEQLQGVVKPPPAEAPTRQGVDPGRGCQCQRAKELLARRKDSLRGAPRASEEKPAMGRTSSGPARPVRPGGRRRPGTAAARGAASVEPAGCP